MTIFQLPRPLSEKKHFLSFLEKNSFAWCVFFYFLFSSFDYLNVSFFIFKVKLTNLIAVALFFVFFREKMIVPREFSIAALLIIGCMGISALNSENLLACAGFLLFFVFNYIFYFCSSFYLFRSFDVDALFRIYFLSFCCVGIYALSQVLFSVGGVILPGVSQYIAAMARGQGLSYEPSFYALYMTPFAMYFTSRFALQESSERKWKELFWPNIFLLASTSTGCFFSYIFLVLSFLLFKCCGFLATFRISVAKFFLYFALVCAGLFSAMWMVDESLVVSGFLKFFYSGVGHFSVQDRWRGLVEYLDIFLEHPWVGVGFGAGPYYLAKERWGYVDLLDAWPISYLSPMNATTEVLAGLGVLGGASFALFLFLLVGLFYKTIKMPLLSGEERVRFTSLALSVCVMLATLQFNQSIMRSYVWVHMGVFCGYAYYLREYYRSERS